MNSSTKKIEIISNEKGIPFTDSWYEIAKEDHFWMQWRLRAFYKQLCDLKLLDKNPWHGIEVGCGQGVLIQQLEKVTPWIIDGAEINFRELDLPGEHRGKFLQYNILEKKDFLKEAYDFLILFDVLEHIETTQEFLEACLFHLKPSGYLFLNVPALQSLMSHYDKVGGHFRRYNSKAIQKELENFPGHFCDIRYWGFSMVPLLFLRKHLTSSKWDTKKIIERGFKPPNPFVHSFFKGMMKTEVSLLKKPFIGSSLLAVFQKKD